MSGGGGEPERSSPKIYVSRAEKSSAAEQSAEREVAERARSGERRSQKWALTRSSKTARSAPLQCSKKGKRCRAPPERNALHRISGINSTCDVPAVVTLSSLVLLFANIFWLRALHGARFFYSY